MAEQRRQLPAGWTSAELRQLEPQALPRSLPGRTPIMCGKGRAELLRFLEAVPNRSRPSDEIAADTWAAVVRIHRRSAHGIDWATYKAAALGFVARARDLRRSAFDFAWRPGDVGAPEGMDFAAWRRLSELLQRIKSRLVVEGASHGMSDVEFAASLLPIPEFDQEYLAALELVTARTDAAMGRLEIAEAAILSKLGRTKGTPGGDMAAALRQVWEGATGTKATISRARGKPSGPFVDYCIRAHELLAAEERRLIPLTLDNIADATR